MRLPLFLKDDDYLAFERVLAKSLPRRKKKVARGEPNAG